MINNSVMGIELLHVPSGHKYCFTSLSKCHVNSDPYPWEQMRCLPSGTVHSVLSFPLADGWNSCYLHRFREDTRRLWSPVFTVALLARPARSSRILFYVPTPSQNLQVSILLSGAREPSPFWYNGLPLSDKFSLIISMNMLIVVVCLDSSPSDKFSQSLEDPNINWL